MRWDVVKLGDAATFINGYPFKPTDWQNTGKEIIRIQNLTGSSKEANYYNGKIPEKYLVTKGDLLISWSGTLGIYEWNREDGWLNQHIFKVAFDKLEFDKSFFKYLIASKIDDMQRQVHGATMQHITKGKFDNLLIPHPPLPIQCAIAARLDHADALRRKDRELLQAYDDLAQAVFVEMFGDPVRNEKGWEMQRLELNSKRINVGFVGQCEEFYTDASGIPLIRTGNLSEHGLKLKNLKYVTPAFHEKNKKSQISPGDILIARHGDNGKACLFDDSSIREANTLNIVIVSVDRKKYLPEFATQVFNSESMRKMVGSQTGGATQKVINTKAIQKLVFPIPPLSLQTHFATVLTNIEQQKDLVRRQQAESEALFGRLLQEAFEARP